MTDNPPPPPLTPHPESVFVIFDRRGLIFSSEVDENRKSGIMFLLVRTGAHRGDPKMSKKAPHSSWF